jgi:hypothetical protein
MLANIETSGRVSATVSAMAVRVSVYLESGRSRVFACALPWPGWARSARTGDAALEALASYAQRYAPVVERAGLRFPSSLDLVVVDRVTGGPTTDFGAPEIVLGHDRDVPPPAARRRMVALLESTWAMFDDVVAGAPEELRRGPRGGGRDRDEVVAHVVEAERAYARKLGVRHKPFDPTDRQALDAMRSDVLDVVRRGVTGGPWPVPYAVRRTAWHVLDHAWEVEDRS